MEKSLNWREFIITWLIKLSGYSAILFVALIFFFLMREGLPALREVGLSSLFQTRWYPIEDYFGILPLITGTIIITIGALLIAVPFGIGTAIYISEIATRSMREFLKPIVELLAGIPSVVLGFLGILLLANFLRVSPEPPDGSDCAGRRPAPRRDRRAHGSIRIGGCSRCGTTCLSGGSLGTWAQPAGRPSGV